MDLDQQIQVLIEYAPKDGVTPKVVEAIAPALKRIAQKLRHPQYYILQTLEQSWILTTISNRANPGLEKNVIYAFSTLKDVAAGSQQSLRDSQILALPVPAIHILFQMMAMETVDSVVFFETPGNVDTGTEIKRTELQTLIQSYLQANFSSNIPPNIA
ncbi:hypothetical protein BST81_08975 [Leptolyngbya sp. 'hensonii']|uniref:hypothetical protein n=1 Tax=Leptolyngbya sp. 'hensonii' TaxID=1922337 RepID=UPI00094F5B00|nr:hypothetical protein [Leptolyngbya sp. 'hensonii']OLP18767.1 hypothetical protein BST81_08975 [Leptolyngbya sp. 'hensonii']